MSSAQAKADCLDKENKFLRLTRRWDPNNYDAKTILQNKEKWTDQISVALDTLTDAVDSLKLVHGTTIDATEMKTFEDKVNFGEASLTNIVNQYTRKSESAEQVPSAVNGDQSSRSTVQITNSSNRSQTSININAFDIKKAQVNVEVDTESVGKEALSLEEELKKYSDWGDASDEEIEEYMAKIDTWTRRMVKIREKVEAIERNTKIYDLDDTKMKSSLSVKKLLDCQLDTAIENLKFEDERRCLYSLNKSKTASVKLPTFSGDPEEDFCKFKKEISKAFKTNKVKKDDQTSKLRESLRGYPKNLVPRSMESIDDAFKLLEQIYGDPARVMTARKKKLSSMGSLPRDEKSVTAVRKQVEWLMDLEVALKGIVELAEDDLEMEKEAYNGSMISTVRDLFPFRYLTELAQFKGTGQEKLLNMIDYIANMRENRQEVLKGCEGQEDDAGAGGGYRRGGGGYRGGGSGGEVADSRSGQRVKSRQLPVAAVTFKQPQRDEKCRICNTLSTEGDTDNLYEDHTHNMANGCPRFAAMPCSDKLVMAKKAKLCLSCLDADYIYKPGTPHTTCPVKDNDRFFTCQGNKCKKHFWLCNEHAEDNKRKINSAKKYWEERKKVFVNTVFVGKSKVFPESFDIKKAGQTTNETVFSTEGANTSVSEARNLEEATEKLKEVATGSEVVDVPRGEPLFLFSTAVGKTKPVKIFYDEGCSHCVFKEGIPGNELDAVRTKKGPMTIGGVGNSQIKVGDEWACLLDLVDGKRQVVQGVAVDKITSDFPMVKLGEAEEELKKSDVNNTKLQCLRIPHEAGGEADVLLGILYKSLFPVIIHTLPSGLFIAKLKIASHGNKWTGAIGGPHKSFKALAEVAGDVSHLMAHFVDGLQKYRTLGAPKIRGPIMSWEEVQFARCMSKGEVEDMLCEKMQIDELDDPDESFDITKLPQHGLNFDEAATVEEVTDGDAKEEIQCVECGRDIHEAFKTIMEEVDQIEETESGVAFFAESKDEEEKLSELKSLVKIQELGISLEYRCPSCRDCSSCRNAPTTERVSLREEAEDQAIKDSIKVDFDKKKITCSLPLRGKEEDFLSNNRAIALKVLDSQCKKVQNDEEAKKAVIKSFYKLFDGGHAKRFNDLTEDEQRMILSKAVSHYLPWRVVYKQSISTPVRTVMDASTKTPLLENKKGGRCLNDLTMKGKVNSLNLLNMMLRFVLGLVGFAGDLKQFYPSIALEPTQWNLQRVLWREGLDINAEVEEIVIVVLIFGVRAVSALSEQAVLLLAEHVRKSDPRLADLLTKARFVDDLADSEMSVDQAMKLTENADKLFESAGLKVKGAWSMTGSKPHPDVSSDGLTVDIGGMEWCPPVDSVTVKIPQIHFGKKSRGRLVVGTETFDGELADLEKFVPSKLTRRQVVSKFAAIFDLFGHLTPETARMKKNVRSATQETADWDAFVSPETRSEVVKDLWRLYKLQGLKFSRAKIPFDAKNTRLHLVGCVDAADSLKIMGVWARFERKSGDFSSQLLIGRSLLSRGGTIPKEELEAMTAGSNLLWICRKALEGWLEDYALCGDSVITLCWITSENKRLSLFHRNRVVQVRLNTDLSKLYHVRTEFNPADIGTRPEKVKEDSVGPNSIWENGMEWMKGSFDEASKLDIIKPAGSLRLKNEEEEEFEKGLIFEKCPEILIRGHAAFVTKRVDKMSKRAIFSKYLFQPTKFDFRKVIRVTAIMLQYLRKQKIKVEKAFGNKHKFRVLLAQVDTKKNLAVEETVLSDIFACTTDSGHDGKGVTKDAILSISDADISRAMEYWYRKGTAEVKEFNSKELLSKIAVEKDGILFSRSRIMDGQRFVMTGGFDKDSLGLEVSLNLMTPVLDRYSPISYSIATFVHQEVGQHAGYETCFRLSLGYCHIIQAASLFREIGDECAKCSKLRRKYIDVVMGPVSDHQLTICPPFYAAYIDLDGPYRVYVPGHERETRSRKVMAAKTWILSFACPVSKLINLQVIESKSSAGVLDGLTRFGCEHGFPHFLLLDQEKSFMKAVRDAEIDLKDLSLKSYKEKGVRCEVSPVAGHNFTGLIERKIRTVQECFEKIGLESMRLHATGLQTVAKLVENSLNNLPMGFSYGRSDDNTPLLKMITPNMMKIGRLNSRAMEGPVRFPAGPKDLMIKVEQTFDAYFRIWNSTMVPKLIPQPKWFKESPELQPEDVVYFQKVENVLSSKWTVGQIDSLVRSKDGVVRRAFVRYYNFGENEARVTDRAVRSLVRIFNVEDNYFIRDMSEVEILIKNLESKAEGELSEEDKVVKPTKLKKGADGNYMVQHAETERVEAVRLCGCCCDSHCRMNEHKEVRGNSICVSLVSKLSDAVVEQENEYPNIYERDLFGGTFDDEPIKLSGLVMDTKDEIYDMLTSLGTDFALD